MSADGDRTIAAVFGGLGAVVLLVDGLLDLVSGAVYLAIGRGPGRAIPVVDQGVIFLVLGLVIALFVALGWSRRGDRSLAVGVVLVALAVVGWLALGLASGVLPLLAGVFVLVSGLVYLVAGR